MKQEDISLLKVKDDFFGGNCEVARHAIHLFTKFIYTTTKSCSDVFNITITYDHSFGSDLLYIARDTDK